MTVHLVNPSHLSFGIGVITPRWLFVLAAATPATFGCPRITDETLEPFDVRTVQPGDVVGVGIHTGNALRGYEIGTLARARGATVIFGGVHATLYPDEALSLGGAHAVVKGDGDVAWPLVLGDAARGTLQSVYEAGRVDADRFVSARWDLLPPGTLHVGLGANGARLSEALLVLLGLAHRRPGAPPASHGRRRGRDPGTPPTRLPVRRAGRRQLLPGDVDRPRHGGASTECGAARAAAGAPRGAVRADGADSRSCRPTWCSSPRSRWRRPKIPHS